MQNYSKNPKSYLIKAILRQMLIFIFWSILEHFGYINRIIISTIYTIHNDWLVRPTQILTQIHRRNKEIRLQIDEEIRPEMALISNVALLQLITKTHPIPPHSHRIIQNTIIIDPPCIPRITPRIARFSRQGIYLV